jgi:para-nitrobenzyl esterase
MLSYGTENLYRRAILQSTPIGTYVNRQNMEKKMLDELNLLPLDAGREEILEAQKSIVSHVTEKGDAKYLIFAPHFGLDPLPPETQIESRLKEIAATHDIMIGSATREVAAYIGENKLLVAMDSFFLTRWIVELIIKKISSKIFINPSKKFAENYASYGGKTYHYKFTWTENKSFVGAAHTLDILPLFGAGKAEGWPAAMKLTSGEIYSRGIPMRKIWADFARSGEIQDFSVPGMLEVEEM